MFLYLPVPFGQTELLSFFLPLKNQIQSDIKNVQIEINGLRELLDSKENEELQELKKEKEDVFQRLEESENELVQQRESVRDCISDVEHQLELSTMEMLQVILQEKPMSECQGTWKPLPSLSAAVFFPVTLFL